MLMSGKKKLSISIPLSNEILDFSSNLMIELDKKFSINFIKNKSARKHINLFSGEILNSNLLMLNNYLSQNVLIKKKFQVKILGFGAFIGPFSTIFLRFNKSENFDLIRKILFDSSKYWLKISNTTPDDVWLPKSTVIYKDMDNTKFSEVIKYLNTLTIPSYMYIEEIMRIEITDKDEIEIL